MSGWSERPAAPFGPTGAWGNTAAPSAEELMMFADGELDERRMAEVSVFLQNHPSERARLDNARLASGVLVGGLLARADAAGANRLADDIMARLTREATPSIQARTTDGTQRKKRKGVVVVLSTTLAAAAAVLLWIGAGPWVKRAVQIASESAKTTPSAGVAAIQVDAVDFGARAGKIFYVKSGDKSPTPVLWVTDDEQTKEAGTDSSADAGAGR